MNKAVVKEEDISALRHQGSAPFDRVIIRSNIVAASGNCRQQLGVFVGAGIDAKTAHLFGRVTQMDHGRHHRPFFVREIRRILMHGKTCSTWSVVNILIDPKDK